MKLRIFVAACAVAVEGGLLAAGSARAADDVGATAAVEPVRPPLHVWLETHGTDFDRTKFGAALARELGQQVVFTDELPDVRIELTSSSRADVRYVAAGESLERSVELPPDRGRAVEVVTWLTVNLVRDEAAELLQELRARRKEDAERRATEAALAADKVAADKAAADKAAADKAAHQPAASQPRAAEPQSRPPAALLRDPWRSVDVALATPISLLSDSPRRELKLELGLGYADVGAVQGLGAVIGGLRVRKDVAGLSTAVGGTVVGADARGLVAAVGYTQIDGELQGVELAAGAALQRGARARGVVAAAGGAFAGDLTGVVASAGIASSRSMQGVAAAAGITVIRGPSEGALLAAGVNFSAAHRGFEAAGGINASRELVGVAVAPINVHRRVKGLQLGVINVAEEVDGAAIGVLSIAKNGRLQPLIWGGSERAVHVALKSIVGFAFTQVGGGIDLNGKRSAYEAGVGAHLRLSPSWFLEPGVHYSALQSTANASAGVDEHQLHYLVQAGLRFGGKLDLLVAGGFRHTIYRRIWPSDDRVVVAPELRVGIAFF